MLMEERILSNIQAYQLRLDNSICDIVKLKTPNGVYEIDGKTHKSQEWMEAAFPYRYMAMYCHENPNDQTNRRVFLYCDIEKASDKIGAHELEISEFNITPKRLYNLFKDENYKKNICVTDLDNLEYVLPNIVKRDKILNDGNTYALVQDLSRDCFSPNMKEQLKDYNFQDKPSNFVPVLTELGRVTSVNTDQYYPVEVTFPNGYIGRFLVCDLHLFHEV
jgi:hypothetical protein